MCRGRTQLILVLKQAGINSRVGREDDEEAGLIRGLLPSRKDHDS